MAKRDMTTSVRVIAEAGVNHNGDLGLALELIAAAAEAGADDVKFQTFDATALAAGRAPLADYQRAAGVQAENQHSMLAALELDLETHQRLFDACRSAGIRFLSSAFDHASLDLLDSKLGMTTIKFGSGELTNAPLLLDAALRKRDVILSTGMAGLAEIEEALGVLAFGYKASPDTRFDPGRRIEPEAFAAAWWSSDGRERLGRHVSIMHCVSNYPAADGELNLRAMGTLKAAFGLPVGYSDHSVGTRACLAAVALGAVAIEKHLTMDRTLPGPDHTASLEPSEMAAMIRDIRAIETMMGSEIKVPMPSEMSTARVARKTIVAARPIAAGEVLGPGNLAIKRAGPGPKPVSYWSLLGRASPRRFEIDEIIDL